MSVTRRIMQWLALRLRPAEPAPDARDLNLPQSQVHGGLEGPHAGQTAEQQRLQRLAHYRAGPWQQK